MAQTNVSVSNGQTDEQTNDQTFDEWLSEKPTSKFVNLPRNGDVITVQFFNNSRKVRVIERDFKDNETGEMKRVKKAQYDVLIPGMEDEGEKWLEAPRTLAEQIKDNHSVGHFLLKIKGTGTGRNVRYSVIAV